MKKVILAGLISIMSMSVFAASVEHVSDPYNGGGNITYYVFCTDGSNGYVTVNKDDPNVVFYGDRFGSTHNFSYKGGAGAAFAKVCE